MSLAYDFYEERPTEMLDGKIYAMASPSVAHNEVVFNITAMFKRQLKGKRCRALPENTALFLSAKDRPIPDVSIVCDPAIIKANGIHGSPDLVVEVLSPGTVSRDRGYKKNLYEKYGVKEYWLVNVNDRSVEVHILQNGKFEMDNVYSLIPNWMLETMTDAEAAKVITEFKTSLFDDLIVTLDEVFEGIEGVF
ncbi:MAG: Uma2 family endonuclease [Defluviitaleaceae bacterium]|nr:Uma2 family endonuclease [Defluviitaleaceae bacterium]